MLLELESQPRVSMSELVLFRACLVREGSSGTSFVSTIEGVDTGAVLPACSPPRKTVVSRLNSTLNVGRSKLGID